ncbi:hypothetical protein MP638_006359 [Amoeboaphelidium occidentale]|nr:hypothetical protein MP638_006359 [Amoeboaphelidium occidentale]
MSNILSNFNYFIFDMDGLLLDTEKIYTRVTEDILREHGLKEYPFSLKQKMMGLKEMEAAELLVKELSLSSVLKPEEYLQKRNRRQKELFPHCQLMPGVEKMLLKLKKKKKKKGNNNKLAIATSSHREAFLLKTLNHKHLINNTEMFHVIVCGDDDDDELFPHCQLMPGVEKMLLKLKKKKKKKKGNNNKLAIATSSHREAFLLKTLNHKHLINDTEMFHVIVCGDDDDVKESKPNPAIFLEAMRRLGSTDSSKCLVFEDAVNGVRAAIAGGFPVVWIPSDQRLLQGQEELMQKCLLVANSMEDLLV